jgi:hypothetical protein
MFLLEYFLTELLGQCQRDLVCGTTQGGDFGPVDRQARSDELVIRSGEVSRWC